MTKPSDPESAPAPLSEVEQEMGQCRYCSKWGPCPEHDAKYPAPSEVSRLREKLEAAHKELCAAVARQWDGKPAFKLSIPARPDHDTDIIIGAALRDALAALSPASAPTHSWMPIETLDLEKWAGRSILVWCSDVRCAFTVAPYARNEFSIFGANNSWLRRTPTHWMPLPAPPADHEETK